MSLLTWRLRNKPVAFWCIGAEALDVAVIRSAIGEPLLLACAGVDSRPVATAPRHAAGLFELTAAVGAASLAHVVALDRGFCRLFERESEDEATPVIADPDRVWVATATDTQMVCDADRGAAAAVADSFRSLGLRLLALDCAPCAELSLAGFLGEHGERGGPTADDRRADDGPARHDRRLDPFAAVSVAPEIEEAALAMGARLTVPVGLALGHLGWLRDA